MIKAIVTDIEGTTSSLSFVKDTLFPYARTHMAQYVKDHKKDPEVHDLLADANKLIGKKLPTEQLVGQFIEWLDEDKKVTPLKTLQGLIWADGYSQGAFKGHIYHDVVEKLKVWKILGLGLYIYSSGSVFAQKLLFSNTEYGDLTPFISGYFDTLIGGKKESESYQKIAEQIGWPPSRLLFLSDIKEELDAAKAIGYKTLCIFRDGQLTQNAEHRQITSFEQILL